MAKLTGQTIAASYDQLLIVGDANGITATAQAVESADDGGNASLLYLSTTEVYNPGTGGSNNTAFGINAGDALATNGDSNTVYGAEAATALSTADRNVAIGHNAFYQATTGADDNVAIGYNAMSGGFGSNAVDDCVVIGSGAGAGVLTEDAYGTVAIGKSALAALTSGEFNVAIGYESQVLNTTSLNNTSVGFRALKTNAVGDNNTAVGWQALEDAYGDADTQGRNTAIGSSAALQLTTGTQGVFIGFLAGGAGVITGDSNVAIGVECGENLAAGNENTFIGTQAGRDLTAGTDNVAIGVSSFDAAGVGESYNVSIGSGTMGAWDEGTNGQVDHNIAIGYQAFFGGNMGTASEVAVGNIAIGAYALDATSADDHTGTIAIGYQALTENLGATYNTAIGYQAGNFVTTADGCTFMGFQAGKGITGAKSTGNNNTAIGNNAGLLLQGASTGNTLVGGTAGSSLTTGAYCTIIGEAAGATTTGANNTFVGWRAGNDVTSGTTSVAVGRQAGGDADVALTGSNNTSVGDQAGVSLRGSAAGNTLIGKNAGDGITTGDSNTVIGMNADTSAVGVNDEIVIGIAAAGQGTNYAVIGNGNLTRLYAGDDAGGTFYGAGQSWSDKRIKENVKDIGLGLDFIKKLTPIQYTKKQPKDYEDSLKSKIYPSGSKQIVRNINDTELQRKRAGFIAQDVLEALKEIGFDENNGIVQIDEKTTQHSMDYASMVVPLVKAVQELSAKVKALEDA